MSNSINTNEELYFEKIFYVKTNDPLTLYPIVKNEGEIRPIISLIKDEKNMSISEKYNRIMELYSLFKLNKNLLPLFMDICTFKNSNCLFELIFEIYLNNEIQNDKLIKIEEFLHFLLVNISLNKNSLEYIYQKLSKFFYKNNEDDLNEELLLKYLNLLHICYRNHLIPEENPTIKQNNEKGPKEIKNYFYFSGLGSGLSFTINQNSTNPNTDFPTLEQGCSFVFWVNLDKDLLDNFFEIYKENNVLIHLISLNVSGHQIKLVIKDSNSFQILIDDSEPKPIDITKIFNYNEWTNICFTISKKNVMSKKADIRISIKGVKILPISLPENFPVNEKINAIGLFKNLVGRVSSFMFFSYAIDEKLITSFYIHEKEGFYKNKILFKFLHLNNKEYFDNSINYKYYDRFKNDKIENLIDISSKEHNTKNMMSVFCPFSYDKNFHRIDDVFGNFVLIISKNSGATNYINNYKNISLCGGITCLLPITELLLLYKNKNNENNILTENILLKYFNILKSIIIGNNKNYSDANQNNFFSSLGLFLEKYPSSIFSENILNVLLEIGKEDFQNTDFNSNNFVNMILLNEKIFSKFNTQNQVKLWEEVYKFFTSDDSLIKDSFNMSKICLLLRFYDEKRYEEFCCQKHANIIKSKKAVKIMNPEMNSKTQQLFEIIQLYIKKLSGDADSTNLFKLLSLDLSPCLQIKVLQVYTNFFANTKISNEQKTKMLNNLLANNFLEITEYLLTVSLLDVRIALLNLLKLLLNNYSKLIQSFLTDKSQNLKNIFMYISYYLLPDNLMVEIDNAKKSKDDKELDFTRRKFSFQYTKTKKRKNSPSFENFDKEHKRYSIGLSNILKNEKEKLPLIKYINKEYYDTETKHLWKLFIDWATVEVEQKDRASNLPKLLGINSYVIDFCIAFTSKDINHTFIDNFISALFAYFTDLNVVNKEALFQNQNLYKYIIDIIFNYHNLEINSNKNNITENVFHINNIKTKALEVLYIFLQKKQNFEERIQYILDYSIYLKKKSELKIIDYNETEITTITSNLLLKALESSEENIYFTTRICFQFLVYYRNNDVGITENEINNNFEKKETEFTLLDSPEDNKKDRKFSEFILIHSENSVIFPKKKKNDNNKQNKKTSINYIDSKELIPKALLDGLHYFNEEEDRIKEEPETENEYTTNISCVITTNIKLNENKKNNKTLKEIWKDYPIFDYIIDYFYSNVWGLKNLCSKINIEYDEQPLLLFEKLYKEYSKGKNSKNILEKELLKCINICDNNYDNNSNYNTYNSDLSDFENINKINIINDNTNTPKIKKQPTVTNKKIKNINILNLNLILLAIAIEVTKDPEQKDYLENQLQQLLIFCVLTSISIKSTDKYYESIQNELYNSLAYGCLYLKKKNEEKYKQIINYLITPIFNEINLGLNKKGIKNIFGISNKILHRDTAVFKLFGLKDLSKNEEEDEEDDDDHNNKHHNIKSLNNSFGRYNSCSDLSNFVIRNKISSSKKRGSEDKDNYNNKKKAPQDDFNNINKDDKNQININFNVDKSKILNNIFMETLKKYRKIFKDDLECFKKVKFFYKNKEIDPSVSAQKCKVFEAIKKVIPEFVEKMKKYSNTSYIKEKIRRNNYKKCKIQLFSWKGFWSNKYLFFEHPEFLKLKVINHYTKELTKPLLSPILDINYYLPKFKKFNKDNLFNEGNYDYYINLDIDSILKEDIKNTIAINNTVVFSKKKVISSNNEDLNFVKNCYGFNYLECLYKLNDPYIWNQYKELFEQKLNFNKMVYNKQDIVLTSKNSFNKKSKKNNKKIVEDLFSCCIVKPTNHIKGHLYTKKNNILFIYDAENSNSKNNMIDNFYTLEDLENDISYDRDMDCCFGSIFKKNKKDKDIINLIIKYEDIRLIFIKKYYFRETAAEIFTDNNKSYYFNFNTNEDLLSFIDNIIQIHNSNSSLKFRQLKSKVHNESKKIIGYEKLTPTMRNKKTYYISNKMEDWQNYNISTMEYLMWINMYSGRSFNDLTQYPILPWVFTNYDCENIENNKENYRNLSLPIGMLDINPKSESRKEYCIEFYESLKTELKESHPDFDYQNYLIKGDEYLTSYNKKKLKIAKKLKNNENDDLGEGEFSLVQYNQIPYNYGTHYSNPTYVSLYLSRIFPFASTCIEIHGDKFDDPERMFCSMAKTFSSVSTLKDDLRELTPEFFLLPDIFQNKNNFNLTQNKLDSEGKEVIINDVELPKWSDNNPSNFIVKMRNYLESQEININKWIDLIFGSYQKGENGEKINNIFMAHTYEKIIKISEINDIDTRNAMMRLFETGATPHQIFESDSKPRIEKNIFLQKNSNYNNSKLKFLNENQTLSVNYYNIPRYNDILNYDNKKQADSEQLIYPIILNIIIIDNDNIKLLTHTNHWINIKFTKDEKGTIIDEKNSQINFYDNTSYKYACSYRITGIETPLVIYEKNKLLLKGGFWDGRLEINSLSNDPKEEPISSMVFPDFYIKNIIIMEMSEDEKLLLCGTKDGLIIAFDVNKTKLKIKKKIALHYNEITSISINNILNMFASASMDGYINLYILPSLKLVRSIYITDDDVDYAKDIFLSSAPLPAVVIFNEKQRLFRSYTINGEKICEVKEDEKTSNICCYLVFKSLNFMDYLIYGTNDGYVKVRSFPKMNLINYIKIFEGRKICTLNISNDKRCCYAWGSGGQIAVIKESQCTNNQDKENDNLNK